MNDIMNDIANDKKGHNFANDSFASKPDRRFTCLDFTQNDFLCYTPPSRPIFFLTPIPQSSATEYN